MGRKSSKDARYSSLSQWKQRKEKRKAQTHGRNDFNKFGERMMKTLENAKEQPTNEEN
ncbi:hypothetical protein M3221_00385 [Domibacillus indicus]|uniref:hypothetical protein n=1 Tax=Domibacillus indicus TaxID=1437523 RepID=UPI00203A98E8|nr:hypothetical protein [Domibacillus indicus]MCM3786887.1 hypothetical protein [Domibacillus indicus]